MSQLKEASLSLWETISSEMIETEIYKSEGTNNIVNEEEK
jgi:hypothetical protein